MADENIGGLCSVCDSQRQTLKRVKSRLLPGVPMFVCSDCVEAKREPRHYIIIIARQEGITSPRVADLIKKRRYVGKEITAAECQG